MSSEDFEGIEKSTIENTTRLRRLAAEELSPTGRKLSKPEPQTSPAVHRMIQELKTRKAWRDEIYLGRPVFVGGFQFVVTEILPEVEEVVIRPVRTPKHEG